MPAGRQPAGRQPGYRQPDGRQPGTETAALAPGTFFSEGTQLDEFGVVQVKVVAKTYIPISTDVYILGTLHDKDGNMYVTEDSFGGQNEVVVNGISHTQYGVRYVVIDSAGGHTGGELFVSKGYVVNSIGRQYCTATVSGNYDHGILRDDDSSPCDMVVNSV